LHGDLAFPIGAQEIHNPGFPGGWPR